MSDRMNRNVADLVKDIQGSMISSAGPFFDRADMDHLRCVIRLTVEFHDYLLNGSVEIATRILQSPQARYVPDAQAASADAFNKYDLAYACESVRSGVDSFCAVISRYNLMDGHTNSRVDWKAASSKASFKAHFAAMFSELIEEANFESRCRLLLDLFKLQIVFAGISYDG